jgi:hypothetical protein
MKYRGGLCDRSCVRVLIMLLRVLIMLLAHRCWTDVSHMKYRGGLCDRSYVDTHLPVGQPRGTRGVSAWHATCRTPERRGAALLLRRAACRTQHVGAVCCMQGGAWHGTYTLPVRLT